MRNRVSTIVLVLIYLMPPIAGMISNRLDPNAATALGVAYLAFGGLILGSLSTAITVLISLFWKPIKPNYAVIGLTFLVSLGLFFVADRGWLSVV